MQFFHDFAGMWIARARCSSVVCSKNRLPILMYTPQTTRRSNDVHKDLVLPANVSGYVLVVEVDMNSGTSRKSAPISYVSSMSAENPQQLLSKHSCAWATQEG